MKCKLGLPQKPGKLYLSKSQRIKEAVVQTVFVAKKHETRLCKDTFHKERDRDLLMYVTVVLLYKQLQIKFAKQ